LFRAPDKTWTNQVASALHCWIPTAPIRPLFFPFFFAPPRCAGGRLRKVKGRGVPSRGGRTIPISLNDEPFSPGTGQRRFRATHLVAAVLHLILNTANIPPCRSYPSNVVGFCSPHQRVEALVSSDIQNTFLCPNSFFCCPFPFHASRLGGTTMEGDPTIENLNYILQDSDCRSTERLRNNQTA